MENDAKKVCPLLAAGSFASEEVDLLGRKSVECMEEQCAWWDIDVKQCAIKFAGMGT